MAVRMLRLGDETGQLPMLAGRVAEFYEAKLQRTLDRVVGIAGPAAIFSWAIAGVMITLIGLSFSELGTMFPVTGGVIRFPMYAFGGFASYSMGWITWIAAAVVPSIETTGVLQYATKWYHFTDKHEVGGSTVHTLTPTGIIVAITLLAIFCAINPPKE